MDGDEVIIEDERQNSPLNLPVTLAASAIDNSGDGTPFRNDIVQPVLHPQKMIPKLDRLFAGTGRNLLGTERDSHDGRWLRMT